MSTTKTKSKPKAKETDVTITLDAETTDRVDKLSKRLATTFSGTRVYRTWSVRAAMVVGLDAYDGKRLALQAEPAPQPAAKPAAEPAPEPAATTTQRAQVKIQLDAETLKRVERLSRRLAKKHASRPHGVRTAVLVGLNAYEGKPLDLAAAPTTTRKRGKV